MAESERSVRLALRDRTSGAHTRVDQLAAVVASVAEPAGCGVFCSAMRQAIEQHAQIIDWCSEAAGVPPRSPLLLAALDEDLAALGGRTPRQGAGRLAVPVDPAAAWGTSYVFEGSAFGAALLLDEARAADLPHAYLSELAVQRPHRWPPINDAINRIDSSSVDLAVASAERTFAAVESALRNAAGMVGAGSRDH